MIPVTPAEADEPRRTEPDWAYLADDEADVPPFMDEECMVRTPGQWPTPIAGM